MLILPKALKFQVDGYILMRFFKPFKGNTYFLILIYSLGLLSFFSESSSWSSEKRFIYESTLAPFTSFSEDDRLPSFEDADMSDPMSRQIVFQFLDEVGIAYLNPFESLHDDSDPSFNAPKALLPMHQVAMNRMSIEELESLMKANKLRKKKDHLALLESHLVPIYGEEAIPYILAYDRLVVNRGRIVLKTKKMWMENLDSLEHIIYVDGEVKDGKLPEGEPDFVLKRQGKGLRNIVKEHPNLIIRNRRVSDKGVLDILALPLPKWEAKEEYKNALVHVVLKGGQVFEVYDDKMNLIYENRGMNVYVTPTLKEGLPQGEPSYKHVIRLAQTLEDILKEHADEVVAISDWELSPQGGLSFKRNNLWRRKAGYENAKVTIFVKNHEITMVRNQFGVQIYPEASIEDTMDSREKINVVHPGAFMEEGEDGRFKMVFNPEHTSFLVPLQMGGIKEAVEKHDRLVIEKRPLSPKGELRIAGIKKPVFFDEWSESFQERCKGAQCNVVVEKGIIVAVFDLEGNEVYRIDPDSTIYLHLDSSVSIVDETVKIQGKGKVVSTSYRDTSLKTKVKEHSNVVISNKKLGEDGKLRLGLVESWKVHQSRIIAPEKFWGQKVIIEVRKGEVQHIYSESGTLIYNRENDDFDPEAKQVVHLGATITEADGVYKLSSLPKEEKIELPAISKKVRSYIAFNKHLVITGRKIGKGGQFKILEFSIPGLSKKHLANYDGLEVMIEIVEGNVAGLYTLDGRRIYKRPSSIITVYSEGKMTQKKDSFQFELVPGKEERNLGLKLLGLKKMIEESPNCILTNRLIKADGGLSILDFKMPNWPYEKMKDFAGQGVTVEFKEGDVFRVFDVHGNLLYSKPKVNIFHLGASSSINDEGIRSISGAKKVVELGVLPRGVKKLLESYDRLVIEGKIPTSTRRLKIPGVKNIASNGWAIPADVDDEVFEVVIENQEVKGIYGKDNKNLFLHHESERDGLISLFTNPVFDEHGFFNKGKLIHVGRSFVGLMSFLKKHEEVIVSGCRLKKDGRLVLPQELGVDQWPFNPLNGDLPVIVVFRKQKLVSVTSDDPKDRGRRIYPFEQPISSFLLEKVFQEEDLHSLVSFIGVDDTCRMLSSFIEGATLKEVSKRIRADRRRLKKKAELNKLNSKGKDSKSFQDFLNRYKKMRFFSQNYLSLDEELIVFELIRVSYKFMVRDSKFLDTLKEEANNSENSEMLRSVFRRTMDYYESVNDFLVKGFKRRLFLRFYQKAGIKFILDQKRVVLADEPGVGKTLQAIGAMINAPDVKKSLIICPHISKVGVWEEQILKHVNGALEEDVLVLNTKQDLFDEKILKKLSEARFVIVNYELVQSINEEESPLLKPLTDYEFDFIAADEGHILRNDNSISEAVFSFKKPRYRVLVTGSPIIGRRPARIYNLLRFIDPDQFEGSTEAETKEKKRQFFRLLQEKQGFSTLQKYLKQYVLRRNFNDVILDRPELEIEVKKLYMSGNQLSLYEKLMKDLFSLPRGVVLARLEQLIRASISTSLIARVELFDLVSGKSFPLEVGSNELVLGEERFQFSIHENKVQSVTPLSSSLSESDILVEEDFVTLGARRFKVRVSPYGADSNKYEATDLIIEDLFNDPKVEEKDKKVVLFTGVRQALFDLQKRYSEKGYRVKVLHGTISSKKQRKKIIDEFNESEEPTIFITTYQTGGISIDLTGAKTGVVVDPPWTFQEFEQLYKRLYRFGQMGDVRIIRLENPGIDQHIDSLWVESHMIQSLTLGDGDLPMVDQDIKRLVFQRMGGNKTEFDDLLEDLKGITRKIEEGAPRYVDHTLVDGDLSVFFREGKFSAFLKTKEDEIVEAWDIAGVLEAFSKLDSKSLSLLNRFFKDQLMKEERSDISPKQMFLWKVMSAITPGFENIDYDGRKEVLIEVGSFILRQMIEDKGFSFDELRRKIPMISDSMFSHILQELDESNIFKVFSMLGLIHESFYKDGRLHEYSSNLKALYFDGSIVYHDEKVVEVFLGKNNVKEVVDGSRPFNTYEESYLGKQVELGNRYASQLLSTAYQDECAKAALGANKFIISKTGRKFFLQKDDLDELKSFALSHMFNLIQAYAYNGIWERMSFKEYGDYRLFKTVLGYGFTLAKQAKETSLHDSAYRDSESVTRQDLLRSEDSPDEHYEISETFSHLLKTLGFEDLEIMIVKGNYLHGLLPEDLAEEYEVSIEMVEEVIEQFVQIVEKVGVEQISKIVHGGSSSFQLDDLEGEEDDFYEESDLSLNYAPMLSSGDFEYLMESSERWKLRMDEVPYFDDLKVMENGSSLKMRVKVLEVDDYELPQGVNTWVFGRDPLPSQHKPFWIAVRTSYWEHASEELQQETLFDALREVHWRNILKQDILPSLQRVELFNRSHILASSERSLSFVVQNKAKNSLNKYEEASIFSSFQELVENESFLPEDVITKTRTLFSHLENSGQFSFDQMEAVEDYLIDLAVSLLKRLVPVKPDRMVWKRQFEMAA